MRFVRRKIIRDAADWRISEVFAWTLFLGPPVGAALLALLALVPPVFRVLVREDSLLEWAQFGAYATTALVALRLVLHLRQQASPGVAGLFALLGLASLFAAGEEISWGQRLLELETPAALVGRNEQAELTLHNVTEARPAFDALLLTAGLYGALAPWFRRRKSLLVPPAFLASAFALVAGYTLLRAFFVPAPGYLFAKFSEWPELCFALALCLFAALARRRSAPAGAPRQPVRIRRRARRSDLRGLASLAGASARGSSGHRRPVSLRRARR